MKLIGPLQGQVAYKEAQEEYQPAHGATFQDLVSFVTQRYGFQAFPRLPPGAPTPPILAFGSGKYTYDGMSFAISQLIMTEGGDIAVTITTEQAEIVLNDLIKGLDENLGYRLAQANKEKLIVSNIVVEFDRGLEDYMHQMSNMVDAINATLKNRPRFNLKRLTFGAGDIVQFQFAGAAPDPMPMMEAADFVIERRQGAPYETNRYFCSAPMSTTDHIRVLEQIEAIARG